MNIIDYIKLCETFLTNVNAAKFPIPGFIQFCAPK